MVSLTFVPRLQVTANARGGCDMIVTEQDTVITTLDAKIAEMEATLDALRRTRAFFAAEWGRAGMPITQTSVNAQGERSSGGQPPLQKQSIGTMIVDILHDAGRPVHVDELIVRLKAKGSQASRATVMGTLSRYKTDGKLRRVAQNTYALKKSPVREHDTASSLPQEEDRARRVMPPIQSGTLKYDCYTILKEQGAFMTARAIYEALLQRGKTFNSQNPIDHVGSVMRDSIRQNERLFTRDEDRRFGLQEWQNTPIPLNAEADLELVQNNGNNNVNIDSQHEE
jgi:hypothetical protein